MTRAVSLFLFLSPPFYLKSPKPLLLAKAKESSVHADKGVSSSCQSRLPTGCPTLTTNVQSGFLQGFRPATKQNTREPTGRQALPQVASLCDWLPSCRHKLPGGCVENDPHPLPEDELLR